MCDVCVDFLSLLVSYESRVQCIGPKQPNLSKHEVDIIFGYIQTWQQRQCMCCYRDIKNFERFQLVVQSMICLSIVQLKNIEKLIVEHNNRISSHPSPSTPLTQHPLSTSKRPPLLETPPASKLIQLQSSDADKSQNEADLCDKPVKCVVAGDSNSPCNNESIKSNADADSTTSNPTDNDHDKNKDNDDTKNVDSAINKSLINSTDEEEIVNEAKRTMATAEAAAAAASTEREADAAGADVDTEAKAMASDSASIQSKINETWSLPEFERLLILLAKAFLLNFPLYIAYKHAVQRLDEISPQDAQSLAIYCDLHENEMPIYLLRNVTLFCSAQGFIHLSDCFDVPNLPVSTAHAITAVVSNLKLWLNYRSIVTLFVPIRSKILQYMCKLADQELRSPATKSMADFMWTAIKDPLDTQITFDTDGLALAFKYFTSTTLTMRLAGMAQINAHINLFNDICTSETVAEVEIVGQKLSDWLIENKIINHLFGPNLHVEVIKQSPIVLRFLAVENQITEEHLNLIWQAAQLKHCSKAIYDVLPPLVKNLTLQPALHLYSLLCHLDPKEHTEQSIFIASTLIKLIWLRDGSRQQIVDMPSSAALLAANAGSSSENSVSIDGSNSDEEHPDDDSSDGHKSAIDIEVGSDSGPTPCKQPRHKNCCEETTDDSSKIEDITDDNEADNLKFDAAVSRINHRLVARLNASSSEDGIGDTDSHAARKKLRKRRKMRAVMAKSQLHGIEAISDGDTDEAVDINDSDCSESQIQSAMLGHLHAKTPFINTMANNHLIGMLSGGENDGSYSSPLSQKSGKNMADFDDDDSPCEEELAQLAATSHCLAAFAASSRERNITQNVLNNALTAKSSRNAARAADNVRSNQMTANEVSQPCNILLWDLLMDDKIGQLSETMAIETEKALRSLLCFNTEKNIRTKFIESCLQNLAANRSVVVSLRLLPNLLASFQQFRAIDTHQVTMWAERNHKMMYHFFNNLKVYANAVKNPQNQATNSMYSHMTQVQVRLDFLTSIFSTIGSPDSFRLSLDQVDQLWSWLANDSECSDCLFAWLQGQAKNSEQHALGIDALQHLYLKKLPELRPEDISMVGLGLIQTLCSLARVAAHYDSTASDLSLDIVGMGHLWKIALRATNTDVSLAAIQYINSYYMGQQLKMEKEFVAHCMNHLKQASEDLNSNRYQEKALMCIQRALMLLNTHLDTFRRRYAYHLRRWALEGQGFGIHSALRNDAIGPSIRIILQPGGLPEKSVLHMHTTDLVADLKAEIAKWWEALQGGAKSSGVAAPVLGFLLSEGPLRIITQGQEITSDYDERTIADVGFKDNQMVYVSLGGRGGSRRRETFDHPSLQAAPPKECLPTVLLLQPAYFEELFTLMQKLGDMRVLGKNGSMLPYTKAQLLSRRVWDILALLPTNPDILESFKRLGDTHSDYDQSDQHDHQTGNAGKTNSSQLAESCEVREQIQKLMDPKNLQKFMYSMHIVESLVKTKNVGCCSANDGKGLHAKCKTKGASQKSKTAAADSAAVGGGKSIEGNENVDPQINCRAFEPQKDEPMKEKEHEATEADRTTPMDTTMAPSSVASSEANRTVITTATHQWVDGFIANGGLRHLFDIFLSGVLQSDHTAENEWRTDCLASLLRTLCLLGVEELRPDNHLLTVPAIKDCMMQLISAKTTLHRLGSILGDASRPPNPHQFKTGFWGRAQVIHYAMNLLVCLVHSSAQARDYLWAEPDICTWLQRFILDDPEPAVRREACAALYRICLGNAAAYDSLMGPVLSRLISFLPVAEKMVSQTVNPHLLGDDGKDPYGPACRDYFWLLCRLVDTLTPESLDDPATAIIDTEALCGQVSKSIINRKIIETRFSGQDDGLVGLLNLMTNLIKYDPPFKFSAEAEVFITQVFDCLFELPSPKNRQKPKCKSQSSRAAAYDLLAEMCRNAPNNFKILHSKLLKQHQPGPHSPYPWDYWPRDDGRSECGYIGLTNLGATCYMASCIQHLFMMPQAREAVLTVDPKQALKHATTLQELQRMFAYLMESERKAYNPRSFCRVYQMDHQPLNTGEQKDMAEFFIDMVSKLEEMTPELKQLIKRLFCGTLSNNVVSLDCGHVSRTQEEFYTVRCQVAQMRDLHESLAEVTVKDTLEGDNMYTCDQCGRKVRAEKRACFKKLPEILCFNTMRYTFNMLTMQKEKVNTHFSFPMKLDMTGYVEKTLLPQQYQESKAEQNEQKKRNDERGATASESDETEANVLDSDSEQCQYSLIGVTVHTGNADGGHYYSFIKERNGPHPHAPDRWFLFNDAEVKQFDPSQIEAECFGGEMTSKTYDTVTEKYLDFSFEKTNSAYMLFYERIPSQQASSNEVHSDHGLNETMKIDDAHEKASCSTTPTTPTAPSIPNKADKSESSVTADVTVATPPQPQLPAQSSSSTPTQPQSASSISSPPSPPAPPQPPSTSISSSSSCTDKMNDDLAIDHKKCDIDSKSSSECNDNSAEKPADASKASPTQALASTSSTKKTTTSSKYLLNKELEEWIWEDNRFFLQDRNIFEHTYFNFMWQICGSIPQSLLHKTDVTCIAAQLSVSFFIETFIHAKEKPTMVLWVELLTKQFNGNQEACEWFLTHMSTEFWWPVQILIKCPNQMVRQMFQRLVIHVIQRLRQSHCNLYLKTETDADGREIVGDASCVTRFIKSLITIMENGAKAHLRHLSEFFGLLYEFCRMGEEETLFLLKINVIRSVADFYLGHKTQDCVDVGSDNDDNSSDETLSIDKTRPASLDKMIALVATLVERSRGPDLRLQLSPRDYNAIAGGKGFPFLYQQIKDNINPHQTRHLIHALCRWDERLANQIITMLFTSVTRHIELCGPFFKLLTLLTESTGGPSGLPCFSQLVLSRVWDAAEFCPQSALDWLAVQAPRNKIAHAWILQSAESWVEQFLLAHNNAKVRNAAAYLLVSLVPSQSFRTNYRAASLKLQVHTSHRDLSDEATLILHTILNLLLRLLRPARVYTDILVHGPGKLSAYFGLMTYCMVSKTEKLMLTPYLRTLWDLFHPRLSEPSVPAHHNKQALLAFWYHATNECPENAQAIASSPDITRNIAFNYILADHDDVDIVAYNRAMLPAYYGLLRLCCQQSRSLTRQLAAHQNLQWAFKNITPHPTQYAMAVDELFALMNLFAARHPDDTEAEQREIATFRRTTLTAYLTGIDARVSWGTLIAALRILVDNDDDRLFVVYNGGIAMCFEALITLHSMYHEATACHVSGDLQELLTELALLVKTLRINAREQKKRPPASALKHLPDAVRRLATLLNTHNPPQMRSLALEVLTELVRNPNLEVIAILCPLLLTCHMQAQDSPNLIGPIGPYFPRRNSTKAQFNNIVKNHPRPPRSMSSMVQMSVPQSQLIQRGIDKEFDAGLDAFYRPYHDFLDVMMRMAVNMNTLNDSLVNLHCLAGIEGAAMHFNLFPRFWVGIYNNKTTHKWVELLLTNSNLIDYIYAILREKRVSLNDPIILTFIELYFPKVPFLHIDRLIESICQTLNTKENYEEICGDLLALCIISQKGVRIPAFTMREMKHCLQAFYLRFKDKFAAIEDEDSTPPPMKKQRKSSSSDSDFYETQSTNKTNESKPDEHLASTASLTASTSKDDESMDVSTKSIESPVKNQPPPLPLNNSQSPDVEDDEMNGTKTMTITTTMTTMMTTTTTPTTTTITATSSAAADQRPTAKANVSTSPTSFSNSSSVSTGSTSPETHSAPINTSGEHEANLEKDIERKLLQKIEYHLMDIFQHLDETESAMESETSSSRYGSCQSKTAANCTAASSDTTSNTSANITATSHKISPATSSIADDDIANEAGPSQ